MDQPAFCKTGGVAVWRWPRELDGTTLPELQSQLDTILGEGVTRIVADLSAVQTIDTMGMGGMLSLLKAVRLHQGMLVLSRVGSHLASLFDAVHLDRVFAIVDNPDRGVELLRLPRTVKIRQPEGQPFEQNRSES